jgi:hypothetical protein
VHCFARSVDSYLCFFAMNPVSRPVFVTYVRVQAHLPGDDKYRARFRCSFSAKASSCALMSKQLHEQTIRRAGLAGRKHAKIAQINIVIISCHLWSFAALPCA